ncbi:uncharacterized protein B0I36DRAFT_123741 [Microdochium trichocladiopsis]|uniref:Uncharacterized protein n=1 Tax=Microdochium trichocladiopsis TaxID=1682393 RepID=A0A9P9BUJ9_9PEZI|nr:uncharacterized protein B0I36DRAFT_123741 [Microdochium trichocladiopsis]KAH7031519.1 hypothetical protein B0I36DRAFT_123741 [Microdochium trichocladiopsis]
MGRCAEALVLAIESAPQWSAQHSGLVLRNLLSVESLAEFTLSNCKSCRDSDEISLPWDCQSNAACPWAATLSVLFRAGCPLRPHLTSASFRIPCSQCCSLYAQEVRLHCQDSGWLANDRLPLTQLGNSASKRNLQFREGTTSSNGNSTQANVPALERPRLLRASDNLQTLYHNTELFPMLAEAFWSVGFQDIRAIDGDGLQPIEKVLAGRDYPKWRMIQWLLLKGVDMTRTTSLKCNAPRRFLIPSHLHITNSTTIAHASCEVMGHQLGEDHGCYEHPYAVILTTTLLTSAIRDDAVCLCAPAGRSPFSYLLLGSFDLLPKGSSPKRIARRLERVLTATARRLHFEEFITALRLITLEALPISHTCGFGGHEDDTEDDGRNGDSNFVPSQPTKILAVFENIITHFQDVVKSFNIPDDEEDLGIIKVRDEYANKTFLKDYDWRRDWIDLSREVSFGWREMLDVWVQRLNDELEKLAQEDLELHPRAAAEEIGVMWCDPPPGEESDEESVYGQLGQVEYWQRKLDEIDV